MEKEDYVNSGSGLEKSKKLAAINEQTCPSGAAVVYAVIGVLIFIAALLYFIIGP